jgi:metallo-beta-lactamase family protein
LAVEPRAISAVILTHAHLDHSGYLPLLTKHGFRGPVFCSSATTDLCDILLRDAARLQEADASFMNRHRLSKHSPALPLFTEDDAKRALRLLRPIEFNQVEKLTDGPVIRLHRAGHILGAGSLEFSHDGKTIVFSGDLGRYDSATMVDPQPFERADYIVVESTYGRRRHDKRPPDETLADIIKRTVSRGGTVVVPAFAVGRVQTMLFFIERLRRLGKIPKVPVFLDSPMAVNASEIFCRHLDDHRLAEKECRNVCDVAHYVRTVDESKKLNIDPMPKIIISASGMATGGRVLHHLKHYAPNAKNAVLFTGFQAVGTRGAAMVSGARSVRIHGQDVPIRADVENIDAMSAHADSDELMRWLAGLTQAPRHVFVNHGEMESSTSLSSRITRELGWPSTVPHLGLEETIS